MAVLVNEYFKGKGTGYFRKRSGTDGLLPIGNATEISLEMSVDTQEMQDYENAGGGTADTISSIDSMQATITLANLNPKNIALLSNGTVSDDASGTVASEEHVVGIQGSFVKFDSVPDTDQPITVTNSGASTTYVEGEDYEIKNGGIVILEGNITDGSTIEVNYESVDSRRVEMLLEIGEEYEFYFDGLNEARSGKPVLGTFHRCKINPTSSLPLISDDYTTAQFTVDILRDDTVSGSEKSKYAKIEMAK